MIENKIESIAIDGPAGVGKSTITKLLAKRLGWPSLETGALYRAITFYCLLNKVNLADEKNIVEATKKIKIVVEYPYNVQNVFINGENLTPYLRQNEVEQNVALVAKVPEVRVIVRKVQRDIATNKNVVVEGRDIGTVVLKNSANKFYLTASAEVRAKRRYNQLVCENNKEVSCAKILKEIQERDFLDMTRKTSPLLPAKDAKIIDTSNKSPEEVVDLMMSCVKFSVAQKCVEKL